MLEQAEWDNKITLDKFNFANIQYNLNSTTYENLNKYLDNIEIKSKELNYLSRVIEVCGSTIRGEQKTTEGIIQQLTSSLIVFAQSKIKNITAKTTIKFDNTKPQAIFIIFSDEEKSTYDFISLFITETYSKLINDFDKSNIAKYHRPIYYINIHFMLVVQSIDQLDEKYNIATRNNILANITYKYYLMSGNNETRKTIAREMGYTEITVQSTSESFAKKNNMLGGVALSQNKIKREVMSAEELATLPFGSAAIIPQRNKPYLNTFDNFWDFTQFKPSESVNDDKKQY
ncbi:type IV secretory system conjugative DNA transfer family protein [Spiroplasma citri]|uniref:TraM recognition domain-containing protein n=1 Tax=Spiroplasma citri TaxID=2133 RepID=A0AAJ4ELI4_SPICI|nr:TraM recognition domain-containing protein [Spiroplasma citri]QIA68021.1 TraM recognition domain-containing protein [Spiroplasma citri]QIA69909.1 TraM recognition domain-containing protein [Spiroplasma citri]QIA71797.1 TraM recognition domain-containing protein [Spiroplasma citri]QIA71874.1 TraM recognition domain-containing protein [Spiroplasma citri]QJU62618.1 TraM recognition domain-containing protein [Spiroplasma citri]